MNKNLPKFYYTNVIHPHLRKIGKSVSQCSAEAAVYTDCCTAKSLNINQYDCKKEFDKLTYCFRNKLKNFK